MTNDTQAFNTARPNAGEPKRTKQRSGSRRTVSKSMPRGSPMTKLRSACLCTTPAVGFWISGAMQSPRHMCFGRMGEPNCNVLTPTRIAKTRTKKSNLFKQHIELRETHTLAPNLKARCSLRSDRSFEPQVSKLYPEVRLHICMTQNRGMRNN